VYQRLVNERKGEELARALGTTGKHAHKRVTGI